MAFRTFVWDVLRSSLDLHDILPKAYFNFRSVQTDTRTAVPSAWFSSLNISPLDAVTAGIIVQRTINRYISIYITLLYADCQLVTVLLTTLRLGYLGMKSAWQAGYLRYTYVGDVMWTSDV